MNEINLNLSNFNDEITNTNKLVLIDFLQHGVDHVKCYLQLYQR